jgi:hypothetical protein
VNSLNPFRQTPWYPLILTNKYFLPQLSVSGHYPFSVFISNTTFRMLDFLRLQAELTHLGLIDRASPYLRKSATNTR